MGIYREVETIVMCDRCGSEIKHWISTGTGVSKAWTTYYARQEGATVGKRGVICKNCQSRRDRRNAANKKVAKNA